MGRSGSPSGSRRAGAASVRCRGPHPHSACVGPEHPDAKTGPPRCDAAGSLGISSKSLSASRSRQHHRSGAGLALGSGAPSARVMRHLRLGRRLLLRCPRLLADRRSARAAPAIPTPAVVFGFEPGADYKLANYDQVVEYFQKVDAASDRVRLVEAGRSTQGRTFYFALVSSTGEPRAHRSLSRDRAAAGASGRTDRRGGARARARGQGVRAHRRRPALQRSRRPAAHAAAALRPRAAARASRRSRRFSTT